MNMHKIPKRVLAIGWILFFLGFAAFMLGNFLDNLDSSPPSSEDWSGTLMFEGNTSTTFEGEFKWAKSYNIFVEDGANVSVEVLNSDTDNIFESCELDDDCDMFDVDGYIDGYHFIGYLELDSVGTGIYELRFTEENGEVVDVMIREEGGFAAFLALAAGLIVCSTGFIVLIIGSILAKVMKENPKVELASKVSDELDDRFQRLN
jgi:hypothetical protein